MRANKIKDPNSMGLVGLLFVGYIHASLVLKAQRKLGRCNLKGYPTLNIHQQQQQQTTATEQLHFPSVCSS